MTDASVPAKEANSQTKQAEASQKDSSDNKAKKPKKTGGLVKSIFFIIYIAFMLLLVVGVFGAIEYYAYLQIKASPIGQAYKGKSLDLARQSSMKVAPQYGYEPTPGFAAVRNVRLGNSYEYINEESFKDFDDVPREKPADEYRVIVTGGSVAYGRGPVPPSDKLVDYYEVTFRWTIPHLMQEILNSDPRIREKIRGKHVRVINAGVAGYVYQNCLMRYLAKLRLFQPDLIVALDGANEVHTVARPLRDWNYFTEGPYFEVVTDVMDMSRKGFMNYLALWLKRNTYFFTWLAVKNDEGAGVIFENKGLAAHAQDATPEMIAMRDKNIDQVADVMAIYHKSLESDRVPHVFALQPMFRNSKKPRDPIEREIERVTGMEKIGFYNAAQTYDVFVDKIKKRGQGIGFEIADLTGIYDNVHEWVFTDWCHLTNGANYIMAKALAKQVKTRIFNLPQGSNDALADPYDSYFKDYAGDAKLLVNGAPHSGGLQVLKGYPSQADVLDVPKSDADSPNMGLDLGSVVPVSRLRLVWADTKSVPENWRVELSEDGKQWKTLCNIQETKTDGYDQWPGFEYLFIRGNPGSICPLCSGKRLRPHTFTTDKSV